MDITTLGNQRIDQQTFEKLLNHIKLKITEDYAFPPEIITCGGATIATLGNFSASVGKPKSKKTFNVSGIVAAAISGKEILGYKANLPEGKKKILYVDTEQSKYHCHKVLERILKMAGLPLNKESRIIDFFVLREYTPEQRRDIISLALRGDSQYGLVVIDGVRDLLRDINNPSEALDIINDLMRWSSYYDLHIHTVLHLNKGDDNTRGHIGSELNNKAETVLQITKNIDDSSMSEVKAMFIRDKEFAPFAFRIDENGIPGIVEGYKAELARKDKKMHYSRLSEEQHREAIESVIGENAPLGYSKMISLLTEGYSNIGYSRGRNTIINLLRYLIEMGLIIKTDKAYQYVPKQVTPTTVPAEAEKQFSLV
jgi:hypothetical protein